MSKNVINNLRRLRNSDSEIIERVRKTLENPKNHLHRFLDKRTLILSLRLELIDNILKDINSNPSESQLEILEYHLKSFEKSLLNGAWQSNSTDPLDRAINEYNAIAKKEILELTKIWL